MKSRLHATGYTMDAPAANKQNRGRVAVTGYTMIADVRGVVLAYCTSTKTWVTWRVGVDGGLDNGRYMTDGHAVIWHFMDRANCLMVELSSEIARQMSSLCVARPLPMTRNEREEMLAAMPGMG